MPKFRDHEANLRAIFGLGTYSVIISGIDCAGLSEAFKVLATSECTELEKAEIMTTVMEQAMKEAANEDMESSRMTGIQFDEKEDREMGIKEKERGKR